MQGSRIAGVGIGLAVLGGSLCLAVFSSGKFPARPPVTNDLQALFSQYGTELASYRQAGATDQELRGYYSLWLDRFTEATVSLEATQSPDAVRFAQLALANGAGEFEIAEHIASEGAAHAVLATDKLSFHQQRLMLRAFLLSRSGSFSEAEVHQAAEEALGVARAVAAQPGFSESAMVVLDFVSTLEAASQAMGGDHARAVALCAEAAELTRTVSQGVWDRIGCWGWAPEQWLERGAAKAVASGDVVGALAFLRGIDDLPVLQRSAGAHALITLGTASRGDAFHADLARAWLHSTGEQWSPEDLRIAYALGFWLTQCSIQPGDTTEGIGILESVLASPDNVLNDADSGAFIEMRASLVAQPRRWQLEPVRSGALTALGLTYFSIGLREEARDIAQQVLAEYPDHPSAPAIQAILSQQ